MKYVVNSLTLGGKLNRIYKKGDIVTANDFYYNHPEQLVEKGFLLPVTKKPTPNDKPRIGVLTCIWKRLDLFRKFCEHWEYIQEQNPEIEFVFVAVGSEGTISRNATKLFRYYEHQNKPVSNKWNFGCSKFESLNVDNVIFLGSDDFICNDLFRKIYSYCVEGYDFIGLLDCYLYDQASKQMVYFKGYEGRRSGKSVGAARCLSVRLLAQMNYSPWKENLNSRLDSSMSDKLLNLDYSQINFKCSKINGLVVDVKTDCNITPFQNELPKANIELLKKIPVIYGHL